MRRFLGKVFCVVIGIPKHQLAVIEQEFYVSGQFFLKDASHAGRHNHLKIISVFWGAVNLKMGLLVLLRFVNAVVVKVRGKDP